MPAIPEPLNRLFEVVEGRTERYHALLLQTLYDDSWAHVELSCEMGDAAAFHEMPVAYKFTFFGFGQKQVLGESHGLVAFFDIGCGWQTVFVVCGLVFALCHLRCD